MIIGDIIIMAVFGYVMYIFSKEINKDIFK